jgi:hypothetical protein
MAFAPDGRMLAWIGHPVGDDLSIDPRRADLVVADVFSGAARIDARLAEPAAVAFDVSGSRVAAASGGGARVWDLTTGAEVGAPASHSGSTARRDPTSCRRFASRGSSPTPSLAAGLHERGCERRRPLRRHRPRPPARQPVGRDGSRRDHILLDDGRRDPHGVSAAGGERFASGDERGSVMIWRTDGTDLGSLQHAEPISHLVFSPDATCWLWPVAPSQ